MRNYNIGLQKRLLSLVLSLTLIIGSFIPLAVFGHEDAHHDFTPLANEVTEVAQALPQLRGDGGLVGFEGDYALSDNDDQVRVIVLFNHAPAAIQVAEAALHDHILSMEQAVAIVEDDHQLFRRELAELLGFNNVAARNDTQALGIMREYRSAISGVSLTLPAYAIPLVAEFDSVFAIYPDEIIFIDPVLIPAADDADGVENEATDEIDEKNAETRSTNTSSGNPPSIDRRSNNVLNTSNNTEASEFTMPAFGNSLNRLNSGAQIIHDMGFRGEGIVIGILDSGIDYDHPAFEGAFLTLEEAHARGMTHITEADLINGYFYGRNFVDEAQFTFEGVNFGVYLTANNRVVDPRDPMEARYDRWANTDIGLLSRQFWTDHGTHVAGTIAARPVLHHFNGGAMGFAPEAQIFMYRVMGPTGGGFLSDVLAGLNQIAIDRPDVVNMSIGGGSNAAIDIQSIAVNNLSLAYDIVFVVAAGNSGDGMHTVGRPATASAAISVAAVLEPRTTTLVGQISSDIQNRTFTSRSVIGGSLLAMLPGTTAALWHQPPGAAHFETTLHPANPDGSYNLVRLPFHPASPNDPLWVHADVEPENFLGTGFFLEWLELAGVTDFEYPDALEMADWFATNMDKSFNVDFDISTLRDFLMSMQLYVNVYNAPLSDGTASGATGIINQRRELLSGDDAVFAHYVYNAFMRIHSSATTGPQVAIRAAYAEATGITFPNNTIPAGHPFYTWLMPYLDETFGDDINAFLDALDFGRQLETAQDFWHFTQRVGMPEFERATFMELVPEEKFGFLDGAFVVIGSVNLAGINSTIMINNIEFATRLGAAGILALGRDSTIGRDIHTTIPYIGFGTAANVAPIINGLTDQCTITINTRNQDLRAVTPFSSRGPVSTSFEIKPDVSAHGWGVVSTMPAFFGNEADDPYMNAYAPNIGTSMAAPGVAGQVALMRQFSNHYDLNWDASEIKSRLMNTAEPTGVRTSALLGLAWSAHNSNPSVFETGAGYTRIDRAILADAFASATFDRVILHPDMEYMGTIGTGSLSFGGVNTWTREGGGVSEPLVKVMTVTVYNASDSAVSYNIDIRRNTANRVGITANWPEGISVTPETNFITIAPHSSETFDVTLNVPSRATDAPRLQLEGWVELRRDGDLEISMPFAAIVESIAPHLTDHSLVRDVITTGDSRFHDFSSTIYMRYTAWRPTIGPSFLFDINNFDPHNWQIDAILGYFGRINHSLPGEALGVERFIHISDGTMGRWVGNYETIGAPITAIPPGNHIFAWENRQATGTATNPTLGPWSYSEYFNLTVSNTPPEITINSRTMTQEGEFVITGRVTDALGRGYNALFALTEEGGDAERIQLEEDGSFTLSTSVEAQILTLYAIDEYLPVPTALIDSNITNFPIRLEQSADGLSYYIGNNVTTLEVEISDQCPATAVGRFPGADGSEWRICEDGTLEIDEGFINWTGALSPWHAYRASITQVEIRGPITAGASLRALFRELTEVEEIKGLTYFNTTATTTMYRMFFGLSGVTALDVTNFDTRNVESMALMFRDASSLTELNVSGFDTGNVTDMREMFRGTQLTQLDLSSFDTGNVTNMNHMFTALHTLRELTLGESFSFIGTPNLVPIRQTESYTGLWQGAGATFTSAQLMSQFDGQAMAGIFVWQEWATPDPEICEIVARGRFANGAAVAGSEWRLCDDGILEVDSGFINWTLVTSPWHAHRTDITEIVFTGPITGGASLRSLFHDLFNLEEIIGLTYFDTRNVTNMGRMFRGASSLTELDLSSFDTRNVIDMGWMFFGASGLESLDVTGFDTSNVVDMGLMFREMSSLTALDVTNFDTSNIREMREMFRGMSSLEALDLSSFDTSNVVNMNHMFVGLASLQGLILGELFIPIGNPGIPRLN